MRAKKFVVLHRQIYFFSPQREVCTQDFLALIQIFPFRSELLFQLEISPNFHSTNSANGLHCFQPFSTHIAANLLSFLPTTLFSSHEKELFLKKSSSPRKFPPRFYALCHSTFHSTQGLSITANSFDFYSEQSSIWQQNIYRQIISLMLGNEHWLVFFSI